MPHVRNRLRAGLTLVGHQAPQAGARLRATNKIRELQRLLGKKTLAAEIPKEAVEYGRSKNRIARSPLLPRDDQRKRSAMFPAWRALLCQSEKPVRRTGRTAAAPDRPTTRSWSPQSTSTMRACRRMDTGESGALLRHSQEMTGAPCVNAKRAYRVMRDHQLLLRRVGQRCDARRPQTDAAHPHGYTKRRQAARHDSPHSPGT
jgi:hypothetical protein